MAVKQKSETFKTQPDAISVAAKKIPWMTQGSVSSTTRIRRVGNSNGVILNNQLIEKAGINIEADIIIKAAEGIIMIAQVKGSAVNTDLSTWDKQFQTAIKKGEKPERDFFKGMANEFDLNEW